MTNPSTSSIDTGDPAAAAVEVTLREEYDIAVGGLHFLGGELDRNYRVRTTDGEAYLAKVQIDAHVRGELQWQEDILVHLADHGSDVAVPSIVRATDGRLNVPIDAGTGTGVLRVLNWVDGVELARVPDHSDALLVELGATAARITRALDGFTSSSLQPTHHWDVLNSRRAIELCLADDPALAERPYVQTALAWFDGVAHLLDSLPRAMVHHDLNDNNVLVVDRDGEQHVSGVLDFNDALLSARITELAVAGAYAMLRKDDPLDTFGHLVAGYTSVTPLTDVEIDVLYPLAAARLCVQVLTWTSRGRANPTAYGAMRMQYTHPALLRVLQIDPVVARAHLRAMAGSATPPPMDSAERFLARAEPAAVLPGALSPRWIGDSVDARAADTEVTATPHQSVHSHRSDRWHRETGEPSTISVGASFWSWYPLQVATPFAGQVIGIDPLTIDHTDASGGRVVTVWPGVQPIVEQGDSVEAGRIVGDAPTGSPDHPGWQLQLAVDPEAAAVLPSHIRPTDVHHWDAVTPDPAQLLGASPLTPVRGSVSRAERMTPTTGRGVWLVDADGVRHLDAADGDVIVGHGDPRLVEAGERQLRALDSHHGPSSASDRLATRLLETMPDQLDTVLFTDSLTDARDLAYRLVVAVAGDTDLVAADNGCGGADLAALTGAAHRLGGLRIADESTVGLGRNGVHRWGFESSGSVPDLVVLGAALANGHPVGAVVASQALVRAAGLGPDDVAAHACSPVAGAVGCVVLDILETDALRERAASVGEYLRESLTALMADHPLIGRIRGAGLAIGMDLIADPVGRAPAVGYARAVRRRLRNHSVVVGQLTTRDSSTLLIIPPMVFSRADTDLLVERLSDVLAMADIRPSGPVTNS
ncbi:aminotransferase class III-fold pyridoxal phosphate-dependent enzyme [Gordonia soli]|uniref:Aminoglycoside phosphotransferase domain-containing protein n=1 Tax=Gordonia soli NBRC 108243 TaxID=1223545 RepID=M0QFN2_9ACTN|nr:aminotransferase class III-fold pyridoxal phosphate-dependent enzyme [Gordonia soli]GAC67405.1 hypothetical protein GS4_07_01540 [Gordonia soli NBRC 108243]